MSSPLSPGEVCNYGQTLHCALAMPGIMSIVAYNAAAIRAGQAAALDPTKVYTSEDKRLAIYAAQSAVWLSAFRDKFPPTCRFCPARIILDHQIPDILGEK